MKIFISLHGHSGHSYTKEHSRVGYRYRLMPHSCFFVYVCFVLLKVTYSEQKCSKISLKAELVLLKSRKNH